MGEFRDLLERLSIKNLTTLNEMPMVFPSDVNPEHIDKYLINPIKEAILNNECIYVKQLKNGLHLFKIVEKFNKIYFLSDENNVIGATKVEGKNSKEDYYYQFKITKKLDDNLKGVLVDLYREASLDMKDYIFSDGFQSISSSTIWRKMFANPEKYGIKGIRIIENGKEVKLTSELDIWGFQNHKQHILVGIKF